MANRTFIISHISLKELKKMIAVYEKKYGDKWNLMICDEYQYYDFSIGTNDIGLEIIIDR